MSAFTLLPDMGTFLDAVYADVRRARERVSVECYIYRDDKLGREFADLLVGAAARGVRTRLLYDPFGSEKADPRFFEWLRARDVEARPYRGNEPRLGNFSFAPRDHARSVLVDGVAYAGGQAWANEWLPKERGGDGWYDVCVRATGPVVEDFARAFERRWHEEVDSQLADIDSGDRHPDVRLVCDSPARESLVFNLHVEWFRAARRRIWVANAYFFPPSRMVEALAEAAGRGVDVRVVVPGRSDLPVVARAAREAYLDWMAAGIRLFEYQPAMMHAKYSVVDDRCTVGSFNANGTSLLWADELNLFVHAPEFVAAAARHFEEDLARSRAVSVDAVRARSGAERAVDLACYAWMCGVNVFLGPDLFSPRPDKDPRIGSGGRPSGSRPRGAASEPPTISGERLK